ANLKDSPRGFREAVRLTATADNGTSELLYTTTAATQYTQAVLVRADADNVMTGRLIMYDDTGATEVDSVAFTATEAWQLVTLTATTNAGQVSTGFRIEIDDNNAILHAFRATAVLGPAWALI